MGWPDQSNNSYYYWYFRAHNHFVQTPPPPTPGGGEGHETRQRRDSNPKPTEVYKLAARRPRLLGHLAPGPTRVTTAMVIGQCYANYDQELVKASPASRTKAERAPTESKSNGKIFKNEIDLQA